MELTLLPIFAVVFGVAGALIQKHFHIFGYCKIVKDYESKSTDNGFK